MSSDEYYKNLISYLDNSYSQTSITITDLQKVLTALNQEQLPEKQTNLNLMYFRPGDYVAAFWIDSSGKYKWHLANVVEICINDTFLLSYFKKIGHNKEVQIWISPEVPEIIETDKYQVISESIDVSYICYFVQAELNAV